MLSTCIYIQQAVGTFTCIHACVHVHVHVLFIALFSLFPCSLQTVFVTQYLMDPRALRQKAISREDRQANDQIKMMIEQRNASRWYEHVHVHACMYVYT